jgi:lipoprotein-anchoring transpeptidase ErfK/SrfK
MPSKSDFMKKLFIMMALLLSVSGLKAQSISYIETTKNWYYIYDQNGRKIKTLSTSQGELKGYSSTFYIIKQGTAFYITFDVNGKRLHTFGVGSVGEIVGVAGDTFTSHMGVWIYTWTKDGKKINTRRQTP